MQFLPVSLCLCVTFVRCLRHKLLLVLPFIFIFSLAHAQSLSRTWEVYMVRGVTASGLDRLTFIDVLNGEMLTTEVAGERYSIIGDDVLYFDYVNQRVMMVGVDSIPRPHPWLQLDNTARRIDWVLSNDGRFVAWTQTYGVSNSLSTVTSLATLDGTDRREILLDGPRDGIRVMPVAFSFDDTELVMDAQPDGIGQFAAYTQFAGLFTVRTDDGAIQTLPGEPACFCAAGFSGDLFVRLSLTNDLRGFDLIVRNLRANILSTIAAQTPLTNVTQAGDVLISPDGALAVYALSNISAFGTPSQTVQTVFMLADLRAMTQRPLTNPITTYVHPLRWTEDNTAIIFTSPQVNGTWKIKLSDGELQKVADETLIGTLTQGE